ncbi:MAG TPA: hypothetical protein VFK57_17695 [Vicinamibacterales bacterium]|nr:hypothetical protein [Vicinamibacterales bacterium]
MRSLKRAFAVLLLVSVCAFLAALLQPRTAVGQGSAPVTVLNNPLPVHEVGTANVNVTNSSLQISGTPTVKLDPAGNTVTLDGTNSTRLGSIATAASRLAFDDLGNLLVSPKGTFEISIKPRRPDFSSFGEFANLEPGVSKQMNFNYPDGLDATFISLEAGHDRVVYSVVTTDDLSVVLRLAIVDRDVKTFTFPEPLPVRAIEAFCGNPVTDCSGRVALIGHKR